MVVASTSVSSSAHVELEARIDITLWYEECLSHPACHIRIENQPVDTTTCRLARSHSPITHVYVNICSNIVTTTASVSLVIA